MKNKITKWNCKTHPNAESVLCHFTGIGLTDLCLECFNEFYDQLVIHCVSMNKKLAKSKKDAMIKYKPNVKKGGTTMASGCGGKKGSKKPKPKKK